jgi:hypothetical protein
MFLATMSLRAVTPRPTFPQVAARAASSRGAISSNIQQEQQVLPAFQVCWQLVRPLALVVAAVAVVVVVGLLPLISGIWLGEAILTLMWAINW